MEDIKKDLDFAFGYFYKSYPNHGKCCECVLKHRTTDSLPYCLFPDNGGDKSNRNHYEVLKKRFENETK